MAHGQSLVLREIRSHDRPSAHKPNLWRRFTVQEAKKAGTSRRRWVRADRRRKRAS